MKRWIITCMCMVSMTNQQRGGLRMGRMLLGRWRARLRRRLTPAGGPPSRDERPASGRRPLLTRGALGLGLGPSPPLPTANHTGYQSSSIYQWCISHRPSFRSLTSKPTTAQMHGTFGQAECARYLEKAESHHDTMGVLSAYVYVKLCHGNSTQQVLNKLRHLVIYLRVRYVQPHLAHSRAYTHLPLPLSKLTSAPFFPLADSFTAAAPASSRASPTRSSSFSSTSASSEEARSARVRRRARSSGRRGTTCEGCATGHRKG